MKRNLPSWLETAVFYQVYPQSFADSNNDGIGDIPGLTSKLDYIESLGCDAIWMCPCFESPFQDAGYDISDFYKVAPRYGTNADLRRLFREAHKRGMRVLLDLVAGHTSIEHKWFKESARPVHNKYTDWFIWTDGWLKSGHPHVRTIGGYAERDGQFMINFFHCQPALNYGFIDPDPALPWQQPIHSAGPKAVRAELKNIMRFWLKAGADGFRVDCAPACIKANTREKMFASQGDLWTDIHRMCAREFPDAALVAEWFNPPQAIEAGFHVDFPHDNGIDFGLDHVIGRAKGATLPYFTKKGGGDLHRFFDIYVHQAPAIEGRGYPAFYTGNHDNRRMSVGKDRRMQEMVFAMVLTTPGVPFIYYGDEIGMRYLDVPTKEGGYTRTGCRTPMQWDSHRNAGFSGAPASKLYLPIDPNADRPTVAAQEKDPNSLLNTVRRLVALRRSSKALCADGEFAPLCMEPRKYPFVYLRRFGDERFVVALNPRAKDVRVTLKGAKLKLPIEPERLMGWGAEIVQRGKSSVVSMKGSSYGIFRV
jgi:glycosidase